MSAKPRPDSATLRGLLREGHFGASREHPPADPIAPARLELPIDRIQPYRYNPRRQINPQYPQIKASIRAKGGLDTPIPVTRRPGEAFYTVRAGGNTRLAILSELFRETGDPAFATAACLFSPWVSESDCLSAHLIENELRGALSFIDKALSVSRLLAELDQEAGAPLNRMQQARRLAELGYPVSRRQLIRFAYAVEVLQPALPEALAAGLGNRSIDEIRELEKAGRGVWERQGGRSEQFAGLFQQALGEADSDGFSLRLLTEILERQLAEALNQPVSAVRRELERLSMMPTTGADEPEIQFPETRAISPAETAFRAPESKSPPDPLPEPQNLPPPTAAPEAGEDKTADRQRNPTGQPVPDKTIPERYLDPVLIDARARQPAPTDLKSLRSRAFVLATRFAKPFHLDPFLKPNRYGHGFAIDAPEASLAEDDLTRWAWWLLFSLSEQAVNSKRLTLLPEKMRLKALLKERERLFERVGTPPDGVHTLAPVFLTSPDLPDRAFQDLLLLIETCRTLRLTHPETQLWPVLTHHGSLT